MPAALRPHGRQDGADAVDGPVEVQRERFLPVSIGLLVEMSAETGACVVEKEVYAPAAKFSRLFDHSFDFLFIRDVAPDSEHLAGMGHIQPCGLPDQVHLVDIRKDDPLRPIGKHGFRQCQSDARCASRYGGNLISVVLVRFAHVCPPLLQHSTPQFGAAPASDLCTTERCRRPFNDGFGYVLRLDTNACP